MLELEKICIKRSCEREKMKKKQQLKTGILISTMALSVIAMPVAAQAETGKTTGVYLQQKTQTDFEHNQTAIKFLSYCNKEDYKTWDQSLGTMTDAEAKEIQACVDEITKNEKEDYQKAKLIYEWIVKNITYAQASETPGLRPYDVFTTKKAVCGGYSRLYKAMLNLAGIPSITVAGDSSAGAHEWNLVYADNKWFYSDSTWGSSDIAYFDKNVAEFSEDHKVRSLVSATLEGDNDTVIGFWEGIAVVNVKKGVTQVKVPEKFKDLEITAVSGELFNGTGIEKLELSKNVMDVDVQGASNAINLREIVVDSENSEYASINGVLFTKDLSEILHYPIKNTCKLFTIPKETTKFDTKQTFVSSALENIYVQEGNPQFSSYEGVVYNKEQTQLLVIPEGKTCVIVPGTANLNTGEVSPFNSKTSVEEVVFQEGIKELPADIFNSCSSLQKVTIPESVTAIDDYAFTNVDTSKLTIYGTLGSYAETYAKKHNIKFSEPEIPDPKPEIPEAPDPEPGTPTPEPTPSPEPTPNPTPEKKPASKQENDKKVPQTGDITFPGLTGSLAVLSGAVALLIAKKNKE